MNHRVQYAIASGRNLSIYAPMKGKLIFRAVLEGENEHTEAVISEISGDVESALESLETKLKLMEGSIA